MQKGTSIEKQQNWFRCLFARTYFASRPCLQLSTFSLKPPLLRATQKFIHRHKEWGRIQDMLAQLFEYIWLLIFAEYLHLNSFLTWHPKNFVAFTTPLRKTDALPTPYQMRYQVLHPHSHQISFRALFFPVPLP